MQFFLSEIKLKFRVVAWIFLVSTAIFCSDYYCKTFFAQLLALETLLIFFLHTEKETGKCVYTD